MNLTHYLIACCIVAGLLGVREAFRFRLLTSSAASFTTLLSSLGVVAWIGLVVSAFFVLPFTHALIVLIIPFIAGNIVRVIAKRMSGGDGYFSPERDAELKLEDRVASQVAAQTIQADYLADIVSRFELTTPDLELLYDRLKRQGLSSAEALSAMTQPKVVEFYFEEIGRDDHCTVETSTKLTLFARNELA
jgi:hypothetical protein